MNETIKKGVEVLVRFLLANGIKIDDYDCYRKLPGLREDKQKEICITIKYHSDESKS